MDDDDVIDYDPGFKGMSQVNITKGDTLRTKDSIKTRRNPNEVARDEVRLALKNNSKASNLAEEYMRSLSETLYLYNVKILTATVEYILKIREGGAKKTDSAKLLSAAKGDLTLAMDIIRYKKIFDALG